MTFFNEIKLLTSIMDEDVEIVEIANGDDLSEVSFGDVCALLNHQALSKTQYKRTGRNSDICRCP